MPDNKGAAHEISVGRLLAYGQMVLPLAVVGLPLAIYIPPFYGGTLGLDLAMIGAILMLARFSDVVTDPIIGRLSDLTRTRWGRRRPWVLAGLPIMVVSAYLLFLPPVDVSLTYLLVCIVTIYFGFTLIVIPYGAWGAELVTGYEERNRVTGSREVFLLLGILLALLAPIIGTQLGDSEGGGINQAASRDAMGALGLLTIILVPISGLLLFAFVSEPPPLKGARSKAETAVTFRKETVRQVRLVLKNGPFRIILLSSICGALAASVNASVAIMFYEHVADLGEVGLLLIFVLFVAALIGAPFWIKLGNRIGKHKAIGVAGIINMAAFGSVPIVIYVIKPYELSWVLPAMLVITVVRGFTAAAANILGMSILADVADLDTLKSGEQRTGFLFSFLGMVRKVFEAAGVGIALPLVAWFGFNPAIDTNTPVAHFALLSMYCLLPLVLWLASLAIIWQYPITPARQARLRMALEKREARRSQSAASDPESENASASSL